MAFIAKHLPDKFYLEGDLRSSLRNRLFREVISNLLIHREFSNGFPAKMIIETDRVYMENWSRPHGGGMIDPENFSPFPKNPVIAKFFHEIGRVDELGSGVRNTFKYANAYTPGASPAFIEGDIFRTIIPLRSNKGDGVKTGPDMDDAVNDAVNDAVKSRLKKELVFIITNDGISMGELKSVFHIERATAQRDMRLLKTTGWVDFEGAAKNGKYRLTESGRNAFGKFAISMT